MAKKYYVVWQGRSVGIFESWEECKAQVEGFTSPKYKSFLSRQEAEEAFEKGSEAYLTTKPRPMKMIMDALYGSPVVPSFSVDGACNGKTKAAEYRGVDTQTGAEIFRKGPFPEGTNNIMEFLALVHALAYCKKQNIDIPIYSDSAIAIKWVKQKKCHTKMQRNKKNEPLLDIVSRAELWLLKNTYSNQILKWETKSWGEIPADFGRK